MSYVIRKGKTVKLRRPRKEHVREPIKTKYYRELWTTGPVAKVARMLAKEDLRKEWMRKGRDLREASEKQIDNGVTLLLFNSGEYYLNKAKEWLR